MGDSLRPIFIEFSLIFGDINGAFVLPSFLEGRPVCDTLLLKSGKQFAVFSLNHTMDSSADISRTDMPSIGLALISGAMRSRSKGVRLLNFIITNDSVTRYS